MDKINLDTIGINLKSRFNENIKMKVYFDDYGYHFVYMFKYEDFTLKGVYNVDIEKVEEAKFDVTQAVSISIINSIEVEFKNFNDGK